MRIACAGEPVYKARTRLAALLHRLGFASEAADGILLAFSEAVSNAILYGNASVRKCVRVIALLENGRIVLEISDHGTGFRPHRVKLPPPDAMDEGGRGLFLMKTFMDDVEWIATDHGTTVRMTKCCASPAALAELAPPSVSPSAPSSTSQTPSPSLPLPATH